MTDDFFLLAALVLFSIALLLWLLDYVATAWIEMQYRNDALKACADAAYFACDQRYGHDWTVKQYSDTCAELLRQMGRDERGYLIKGKRA